MPNRKRAVTQHRHFTEGKIAAFEVPEETIKVYDAQVKSLGLKLLPNGRRVYFWWRAVAGKPTWKTIGDSPEITLSDARSKAQSYDILLANWKKDGCPPPNPFKIQTRVGVPTFGQLVEAYCANRIREHSLNPERAEYQTRQAVKKHLSSWLNLHLDEITVDHVLDAKRACGNRRYAAGAIVGLARTLFNWSSGKRDGKINFYPVENPATDISLPKKEKRKRFLQPAELVKFFDALGKEEHRVLHDVLALLLATGARKSNVYAMRWQDVSFDTGNWFVPMSKSGEGYIVNLQPAALKVLERRRREVAETEQFVFPSHGRSGHITTVKKPWTEFRKQCGFPDVRLHDLRRTRGSYLAISGVSLQQIGAVLGHKSLGSTEVYAQLHSDAVSKALEAGDATMTQMMRQARKRTAKQALLTA
jgi:integrase